jgi:hypothetical protein
MGEWMYRSTFSWPSWCSSVPPGKCWNSTSNRPWPLPYRSFPIKPSSYYSTLYILATDRVAKYPPKRTERKHKLQIQRYPISILLLPLLSSSARCQIPSYMQTYIWNQNKCIHTVACYKSSNFAVIKVKLFLRSNRDCKLILLIIIILVASMIKLTIAYL